jgi:hypothetical protein
VAALDDDVEPELSSLLSTIMIGIDGELPGSTRGVAANNWSVESSVVMDGAGLSGRTMDSGAVWKLVVED